MLRMGVYCKYKGKLFRCTVYDNYSKVTPFHNLGEYTKHISVDEAEWFCDIHNEGKYKDFTVVILSQSEIHYSVESEILSDDYNVFTKENGFSRFDQYLFRGNVLKSEITDIVENKSKYAKLKAPDNWDF